MKMCEYGCGRIATKQFKNGKYCCSDSWNKCPAKAIRSGLGNKGKVVSEETKKKLREINLGKTSPNKGIWQDQIESADVDNCTTLCKYCHVK